MNKLSIKSTLLCCLMLLPYQSHGKMAGIGDTIESASELDYPPFAIVLDNGEPDGFSVELMKAAAGAMGVKVNFKVDAWNKIKQALEDNKLDALPLVGRSPEREKVFDFTFPYISLYGAVFVNQETPALYSVADLKNLRVAVLKGDNAEEYVLRENISEQIQSFPSYEQAFRKLDTHEVDAVIAQHLVGLNLIRDLELGNVETGLSPLKNLKQDFSFAVTEGDRETLAMLNEGLSIIMANGEYEQIRNKWLSALDDQESHTIKILKILLFSFLILFIASLGAFTIIHFRQHRQLINANRSKSEFLANMSHELRTPMHAISNFARIGHRKSSQDDIKAYFDKIMRSADRLTHLLNDLLDLSKLEAGKITLDCKPHDLMGIITQAIEEIGSLKNTHLIRISPDPLTKILIDCDDKMIYRVLLNLLTNAVKFSDAETEIKVHVKINEHQKTIRLGIEDQGVGIPQNELEEIFDKFIQSSKTKTGSGGTGLGLSICKEIVQLHNGRIWAESPVRNSKRGTGLYFEIPLTC